MGMYAVLAAVPMDVVTRFVEAGRVDDGFFDDDVGIDLQKMWHGLHYLLAGTDWEVTEAPLSRAILGGVEIGSEEVGYGPARYLGRDEVRAIASALEATPFEQIWTRFDPARMSELQIYPDVWDEEADELREELKMYFDDLVSGYAAAAREGKAMLLAIT